MEWWLWDASDVHARRVHHKRWSIGRFGDLVVGVPGVALVIRRVAGVFAAAASPRVSQLVMSEGVVGGAALHLTKSHPDAWRPDCGHNLM